MSAMRMTFARRHRANIITALILSTAFLLLFHDSVPFSRPIAPPSPPHPKTHTIQFQASTFDWATVPQHYPVASLTPLPHEAPKTLRRVQHRFSRPSRSAQAVADSRRGAVKDAFQRSWSAYKEHAWLHDELRPVSGGAKDPFGGWGATLVDSLDTLWIMDLKDEFYNAAAAAATMDFNRTVDAGAVNLFETTIRHLGGLLSAYDLSGEEALLMKARELGETLYHGFDTPNRMPGFWLNFEDAHAGRQVAGTNDPSASPGSLCMEFTRLAQLTSEPKFFDATDRIRAFLDRTQETSLLPGMWPVLIDFRHEAVDNSDEFSLGALADSLYEYLLKMYILLSGAGAVAASYEKMYRRAMDVITQRLLYRAMLPTGTDPKLLFVGTAHVREDGVHLDAAGEHLQCFLGGLFALGGKTFGIKDHVVKGEQLARGCAWVYSAFPTGLMPEYFDLIRCEGPNLQPCKWDEARWLSEGDMSMPKGFRRSRDTEYILRPEAIESIFLLYRMTGHEDLREAAWTMFQSIMKTTRTGLAYSAIKDVNVMGETEKTDSMESFWLAETLKYFYLIFSPPNVIDLDQYVFNTEAHPFRRR